MCILKLIFYREDKVVNVYITVFSLFLRRLYHFVPKVYVIFITLFHYNLFTN